MADDVRNLKQVFTRDNLLGQEGSSGDPESVLAAYSARESQLLGEIAERQQILAEVRQRKAKVQASLQRASGAPPVAPMPGKSPIYSAVPGGGVAVTPRDISEGPLRAPGSVPQRPVGR